MAAQLNHTIVWSSDQMKSATFLAEMLGRPASPISTWWNSTTASHSTSPTPTARSDNRLARLAVVSRKSVVFGRSQIMERQAESKTEALDSGQPPLSSFAIQARQSAQNPDNQLHQVIKITGGGERA